MNDIYENKNIKHFWDKLHPELIEYFKDSDKDPVMLENIKLSMQGKGVSERIFNHKKRDKWEVVLNVVLSSYSEAVSSIENMQMISIFVRQYPNYKSYQSHAITPTRYLKYHIENYLSEVYIFEQRIFTLLRNVEKLCDKYDKSEIPHIVATRDVVTKALENIVKARGGHVHSRRFEDDGFDRLSLMELLSNDSDLKGKLDPFKKIFYHLDRAKWSRDISKASKQLTVLLGIVLKNIEPIIFESIYKKVKNP